MGADSRSARFISGSHFRSVYHTPRHVYVHVPFCRSRCAYCDFSIHAGRRDPWEERYMKALKKELMLWQRAPFFPLPPLETLYIGGGTPTELSAERLADFFSLLRATFGPLDAISEVTIEANPETVTEDLLSYLRTTGVNRLSLGVQTFDDRLLKRLGRIHDAARASDAVHMAARAGFSRISIDLMFGLPEQTMADVERDLLMATQLPIDHLSYYNLQIEPLTRLGRDVHRGTVRPVDEEEEAEMYERIIEFLAHHEFYQYELSNFAHPGGISQHNLAYWTGRSYLGLGPSAHGFVSGMRYANIASLPRYVVAGEHAERVEDFYATKRVLSETEMIEEFLFLGLRLTEGVRRDRFQERFGRSLEDVYGDLLSRLAARSLLIYDDTGIRLPKDVYFISNEVMQSFLLTV
ncbi:MAG: hypothetical protein BSOLF_2480 [Candidatus Carbobacillus altaicus]|uniref:Heme chaperone HemW n=1 Tax=Candidatus Carbonibacillus altaicus TaxID=2163959 RepID=A0A2R6Y007_9BACL|nr:MAG: hypothetical protein BSOLF_1009 [Candidatus Carbobacillus altaicus]PTQ56919.1 MAG: hypothetical protein BSOLF_2480 [Candidatus Carbobacillus altaicus]